MSVKSKGSNNMGLSLRQVSEGQLLKYTNMIQGWQNRWFVLDPHTGLLEYFMTEHEKKQRPRASLHLAGAIVVPSEEDSYTFTVNGANDEAFKLRAVDAKERQYWINRLRVVAQAHTQVLAESNPPLMRDHTQLGSTMSSASVVSLSAGVSTSVTASGGSNGPASSPSQRILSCQLTVLDAFSSVRDYLRRVECEHQRLIHDIEALPSSAGPTSVATCTDADILVLKATSQATLLCLEQCLAILHYQQQQPNNKQARAASAGSSPLLSHSSKFAQPRRITELARPRSESAVSVLSDQSLIGGISVLPDANKPAEPVVDDDEADYIPVDPLPVQAQPDGVGNEEYKMRMLKLLSQLKLGTELTRVHLPILFCEPRSLLQVLADGFSQPQILLKMISEPLSAEQRIARVSHWYLNCYRAARLAMTGARKPFNPILGETFKCIWNVKNGQTGDVLVFRFLAEQVSHSPPVTAFHLECPQKHIRLQGNLSVKAKYMGMYASAALSGELTLELPVGESGEDPPLETYEMTYPTLYVRSLLSEPWMEFGGKIQLTCPQTRVMTGLVFQTKPFYGGKPHQVTAEIKSASGNPAGRLSGDWMSATFDCSWMNGPSESFTPPEIWPEQKVRPLAQQAECETLNIWQQVQKALAVGDNSAACQHKKMIEEQQRKLKEQRADHTPRFFVWDNDSWLLRQYK